MRKIISILMKVVAGCIIILWASEMAYITIYLDKIHFPITFWNIFLVLSAIFASIVITAVSCTFLWIKSNDILNNT